MMSGRWTRALASAVVGAALTASSSALSGPSPAGSAQANEEATLVEKLVAEGRVLFQKGDAKAATEKLLAAWKLQRSFAVAANLGVAELDLGRMRDAAEHLDFALHRMPLSTEKEKRERIEEYLRKAQSAVGSLHIRVDPEDAALTLDGEPLPQPTPATVYVTPGQHRLIAESAGRARQIQFVEAAAGKSKDVLLHLPEVTPAPPKTGKSGHPQKDTAAPDDETGTAEILAWTLAAAGGVGLGLSCIGAGVSVSMRENGDRPLANALIGTGVTLTTVGIGIGVFGVVYEDSKKPPQTAVRILPYVDEHSGGLRLRGSF